MLQITRKEDLLPVCPHCKKELTELYYKILMGGFGKRYVYFCSDCRAVLGVSHRKGFWMG